MRALNIKLVRNFWELKGQGLAIALVVTGGVATFVMSLASLDSLRLTRESVYHDQNFAEVFADLKRGPEPVAARLRGIPGIAVLETRVRAPVHLRLDNFADSISGLITSIPDGAQPELNRLFLRSGSLPDAGRADQVLVGEAFAEAHALHPGDFLSVVINGRFQRLIISGVALSPEYIYQIRPGELFPDFSRYTVLWMNRKALAAAFGMEGAFNNVVLTLSPGYSAESVIDALDLLLEPWGGFGAYGRDEQISHRYLDNELIQLEVMASFLPVIFIGIAVFLLNIVTARLVRNQREQIAVLKAFGYGNFAVSFHYLMLVMAVVAIGAAGGIVLGSWLAGGMSTMYQEFFRFPWLEFRLRPSIAVTAVLLTGIAAALGTLGSVRSAFRLPPAEAMRPPPPARYRRALAERLGIARRLSQPARMILRNMERQPVKSLLSVLGIACAVAILMLTGFQQDSINHMLDVQFRLAQKQDMTVVFNEPVAQRAVHELAALQGVRHIEGFRAVPAILRHGHREYRGSLQGYTPDGELFHVLDADLKSVQLPETGVLLTEHLGKLLGVASGDVIQVRILEGQRPRLDLPVTGLITEYVGIGAYMQQPALNRLLREGPTVSGAFVALAADAPSGLQQRIESMPAVASVNLRQTMIDAFQKLMSENILIFMFFNMLLAGSIAFAVVYNNARIAFAERGRELASLRVLGFTRAEVAFILLGELTLLTLLAIPPGFLFGAALSWLLTWGMQTDLYRVPLVLLPSTYAFAAVVVLLVTLISALLIGRNLGRLDMVTALKISE
jgi:putative ABC transport system permease protein